MVREFLRAELSSPRFSSLYRRKLAERGWDTADLFAAGDEAALRRQTVLGAVRGYRRNTWLFEGFPDGVQWARESCSPTRLDRLHYGRFPEWASLTGGSRRVRDGAHAIATGRGEPGLSARVASVLADLRRGLPMPALIAAAVSPDRWVLLEGHTRATALARMESPPALPMIVGHCPDFSTWAYV